jgi:NifB/MoaA-like Fe-S oxidoreductase
MPSAPGRQCTLVTGTSAGPLFEQVFRATLGSESACRVLAVRNRFFGDSVTVAGLLAGRDVADALASAGIAERPVILPGVALSDGKLFIDSYPLSQLRSLVGAPVVVAENATDIVRAIA